ncbi:MAG TPA: hypothetical protein VGM19_03920 [Armatimonadota bacterium]|jgi:alpha-L-fucosidase
MPKPLIRKLGTLDCDIIETTPVVWQGRLLRFEYVQAMHWNNHTGRSFYHFVDMETGAEAAPPFAWGMNYGSAHVEGDTMYVIGSRPRPDDSKMDVFWSRDLVNWETQPALDLPGWGFYNQSFCKGPDRYIMAFEVGEPAELVGQRFTCFFAESDDLKTWRLLPPEDHVYARDRYTACPVIRWLEPYYYMIYLELFHNPPDAPIETWRIEECTLEPYMVRTRDFVNWESSPHNPVLSISPEDKWLANPNFTEEQKAHIAGAVNRNNSDVDLCEYRGQTIILYSWGAQSGTEFLAEAIYDGPLDQFFHAFYDEA